MAKEVRYYEDPSIANCCAVEYDRLWSIIEAGTIRDSFYVAREKVLAYEIPRISRLYGPVGRPPSKQGDPVAVAGQCLRCVQECSVGETKAWEDAHRAQRLEAELTRRGGKLLWVDRLWMKVLGYPFTF